MFLYSLFVLSTFLILPSIIIEVVLQKSHIISNLLFNVSSISICYLIILIIKIPFYDFF